MRWSLLVAVFGLSIADVASFAQGPPGGQRPGLTRSSPQDAGFFNSTGVVRFQLIQGRLALDAPRHRKGSQNRDEHEVYESITVTAKRGIPSMHYVCQTPEHHLTLSVQKAESLRIESWFPKSSERSVLDQPASGMIKWTHSRGDLEDQYTGATLLHVRHSEPENFDLHFGFLIERLLRGQSLKSLSDSAEGIMIEELVGANSPGRDSILACVDQLRSKRRSARIAAERQLLVWGTPIVPTIQRIPPDDLDAEQQDRLRRILRRLRPGVDDTPATLAKLLVNDHSYWTQIANRLSGEQLRLANDHLEQFGADPILVSAEPQERIAARNE